MSRNEPRTAPLPMRAFYWLLLLPLAWLAAWAVALLRPKVRRGMAGRAGMWREFRQAVERREPARPLVWVHAASAGEFLQAEPVLRRLRERGAQLAVSLGSVSGLPWLARIEDWPELVWGGLLPFDFPWNLRRLLAGLRPQAIVYVQADLWPGLVWTAQRRGLPQLVIAARTGSGANYRAHALLRPFFRALYGPQAAILCLTEADRAGMAAIVPGHPRLEAVGDPGIETVFARLKETTPPALPEEWIAPGAPVLVAGSTWPADEALLIPALKDAFGRLPALRAILAPHEPSEARLKELEGFLADVGTVRLSVIEGARGGEMGSKPGAKILLVDAVGRLASLYALANVAYVGGGLTSGVHNLAEPAACALPLLFGPRHNNSAVAGPLLEAGAAQVVTDEESLGAALLPLLTDEARRRPRGEAARKLLESHAGAAQRCYEAIVAAVPELREG